MLTRTIRPARPDARRRSAFTLLELLVALAMVSILSVSLYQSLRIGFDAKSKAEAAVAPGRTSELAMELLRADIESTVPPNPSSTPSTTTTTAASTSTATPLYIAGSFIGTDAKDDRARDGDDLIFFTTSDGPTHPYGDGEIRRVELTIIVPDGSTDHVLVRRVTSNVLSPQQIDPDDEVICRHVYSFNLRYYDGTVWQDNWDSTQNNSEIPAAVEVTLELEPLNGDPKAPPLHFVRIFPISCSTVAADASSTSTTGGTP